MPGITSREDKPIPGVDYSEIRIPDEKMLGSGAFTTVLEPKALSRINPIISNIQNEPVFLMIVSINIAIEEVTAMIGESHSTPPKDRKVFKIPADIDLQKPHDFTVRFNDWKIVEIKLDGSSLQPSE